MDVYAFFKKQQYMYLTILSVDMDSQTLIVALYSSWICAEDSTYAVRNTFRLFQILG